MIFTGQNNEYVQGASLQGVTAPDFFQAFLRNNQDLITAGGFHRYSKEKAQRHHTRPDDHGLEPLNLPVGSILTEFERLPELNSQGLTAAIGLAFELNPLPFGFKKPICASLIGIDGEIIPSETNMRLFTENCKKQYENYVLFQAAERSYFLLLLRSLCWEDRTYFREYIRTAETIAGSDALHPLLAGYYDKGQQETYPPDYKQIARQVLEKATHLGEPGHALPIDIRHGLGHSVLTNSRSRANPSDPRGGCDFQPFMRVGSKYSSDDVFRVVASSDWVHFRFEANSYDGTISLNPPPVLDCWRY